MDLLLLVGQGYKRMVDALGYYNDEGRGVPAISFGELASEL